MSDKIKRKILIIYGIALSVLLVAAGIYLIMACVSVYRLGDRPFTPENISTAFRIIKIPIFITIGAIVAGIILKLAFPTEGGKVRATPDKKKLLARLEKRLDASACDESTASILKREQTIRASSLAVCISLSAAAITVALVYVLNPQNYPLDDYNGAVISAFLWVLPCALVALGLLIAHSYIESASLERSISAVRSAIDSGAKNPSGEELDAKKCAGTEKKHRTALLVARICVLAVAVFFIIEGITNGGASDVLIKAINICTECIGLG